MKHKLSAVIFTFVMAAACMTGCLEDKKNSSAETETTTAAETVTEAVTLSPLVIELLEVLKL